MRSGFNQQVDRMNNPQKILKTLDSFLHEKVQLILYGRAALVLGYKEAPLEFGSTMDVDAILPVVQMSQIEQNEGFWNAVEETNRELESSSFYITHFFADNQVILSPSWLDDIQPINFPLQNLQLFRPSTYDLILTKMMRVDPQDRSDIVFLLGLSDIELPNLETKLQNAVIPQIVEIEKAFKTNWEWLKVETQM